MYDLEHIIAWVYNKYPEPKSYWTKMHKEKRACELWALDNVMYMILENPFEDPKDIVDDYEFYIESLIRSCEDNQLVSKRFEWAREAVHTLLVHIS